MQDRDSNGEVFASLALASPVGTAIAYSYQSVGALGASIVSLAGVLLLLRIALSPPPVVTRTMRWIVASRSIFPTVAIIGVVLSGAIVALNLPKDGSNTTPSPRYLIEGEVGVGNVDAGDVRYQPSVLASPGDVVKFSAFARNREIEGAISGLTVKYRTQRDGATDQSLTISIGSPETNTIEDVAAVNSKTGESISLELIENRPVVYKGASLDGGFATINLAAAGTSGQVIIPLLNSAEGSDSFTIAMVFRVVASTAHETGS